METGQEDRGADTNGQPDGVPRVDVGDTLAKMPLVPSADQNGGDSADSDISMSSDSDSSDSDDSDSSDAAEPVLETTQQQPITNGTENMQDGMDPASKKRKSPGGDAGDQQTTPETQKKARLDSGSEESSVGNGQVLDKSLLAPEVWHHIFTFCPPKTLGNLLRVNKLFHQYLSAETGHPPSASRGTLTVLKPPSIWQLSRRLFWPHMPAPLRSLSELSMWRLLCSTKCQECNKSGVHDVELPADNLHNGPGLEGVVLVWPFGVRVCGTCLLGKATKEIDVLLSSSVPSNLIPALPFVHITKELHAVSLSTVEQGQLPPNVQVTKLFLASDVQEIKKEFIFVRAALGSGALEEWLKGLGTQGRARLHESRKWEKWASSGSLQQVRHVTDPYTSNNVTVSIGSMAPATAIETDDQHQAPAPIHHERTQDEVLALKAARRAELERRASLLNPPLTSNVLRHMVSFQAAIQLIAALDDHAWALLKPRLLAERPEAEELERKVSSQIQTIQGHDQNSHLEATLATTKEAKDAVDRDWEEVQAPLRARIVGYVDEFIRNSWDKGKKVKQDTCTKFAAEALIYIRKQFYAQVAEDAKAARAAGKEPVVDPPQGPFTQKLSLENMRWIFDTKIKPLTYPYKKEVFFCNGCAAKPFGFEGVVQHYAAKHTDKLSRGSIVVHWRAEWPEGPPFNPEGRTKVVFSAPVPTPYAPGTGPLPPYPFNGYAPPPGPGAPPPDQSFVPGPAPGPTYGAPPYGEQQYQYQYPGYPATPIYPPPAPGLPPQSYPPPPGWGPYQNGPSPTGPYPHNPTPPQPGGYQQPMAPGPVPLPPAIPGPYNYGPGGYPGTGAPSAPVFQSSQAPYPVQLDHIVRNSREIWTTTANIRDLPGSVRIFVTIHHVVKRFRARFSVTPPLAIFQDGLSNHKDMRPVRNINTLTCKACQLGLGNARYVQEDRNSFSLPQLVNHFQSKHVEAMQKGAPNSPPLDWTVDMILLPGPGILAKLRAAVGSHGIKYELFADAFPEAFVAPVAPYYGQHSQQHPQQHHIYQQEPQYPGTSLPQAVDSHERFYTQQQQQQQHQQGPHQARDQPGPEVQNPYQQQPSYGQPPPQNGYTPAPAYQTEQALPNPVVASVADNDASRREENSSRSSQGSRPRPQQNDKRTRKERKKHAQMGVNKGPGPGSRKWDEEPKLPEEEKAREEEMRAMWANDRAATARVVGASATVQPSQDAPKPQKQSQAAATHAKEEHGGNGPDRTGRPPPEAPSLLDALEMHLDQGHRPVTQSQPPPRDQAAAATYGQDSHSRATVAPEAARQPVQQHPGPPTGRPGRPLSPLAPYYQRAREEEAPRPQHRMPDHGQYDEQYPQESAPRPDEHRYEPRDQAPPAVQYRDAPPPVHRSHPHQPYDDRGGYRPDEQVIYDRPPPPQERPPQDYHHRPSFPGDVLPPPPRGPPTGQLYEIIEVIDAQGSYFIRRPIGRAPPPEAEQPSYYDYPYEPERHRGERQPPIGTATGGPESYPARPGPDDGYSRPPPPARPAGDDEYARAPPPHHQAPPPQGQHQHQRDEYPPPLPPSASRAWGGGSEYLPHQYQRPAESVPEQPPQARNPYEEEYDPRHPAPPAPGPLPPGSPKYQRRQVRYD